MFIRTCKKRAIYGFSLLAILTLPLLGCGRVDRYGTGRVVSCWDNPHQLDFVDRFGTVHHLTSWEDIPTCEVFKHGGCWNLRIEQHANGSSTAVFQREETDSKEKKP